MANPGLSVSVNDVDACLARFDEDETQDNNDRGYFYEEGYVDSKNYSVSHGNSKRNKVIDDLTSRQRRDEKRRLYADSSYKVSADEFSKEPSSRLSSKYNDNHIMHNEQYTYSSPNKMGSEVSEEYDRRQRNFNKKQEKQYDDSSYSERSANTFLGENYRRQRYRFAEQNELHAESSQSIRDSDMHHENSSHYLPQSLNRKASETEENMLVMNSKHANYEKSPHNNISKPIICNDDLKESRRVNMKSGADFKNYRESHKMIYYEQSRSRIRISERSSPQNGYTEKSKFSLDIDYKRQKGDANLSRQENDMFKKSEAFKNGPSYSRYFDMKHSKQSSSGFRTGKDAHYEEKGARRKNISQSVYADESNLSYPDTGYDEQKNNDVCFRKGRDKRVEEISEVLDDRSDSYHSGHSRHSEFKRNRRIDSEFDSDFEMSGEKYAATNYNKKGSKLNLLSYDDIEEKQRHCVQNNTEHKMHEISKRNFYDKHLRSESEYADAEIHIQEKYDTNEQFRNEESSNIWRRRNEGRLAVPNDSDLKNRRRRSTVNTFTMHDARKIAPLVLKCPANEDSVEDRESFQIIDDDSWFENKRKCWTRVCWSRTKHSHALAIAGGLQAFKDRNAIVNSMRSPQYATKAKKQSCSNCWSSLLKGCSSRFQLWNSTLKKIEGQFGTGVVSYFVFLRWLILLNFVIFIMYFLLIILPYSAFSLMPHRNTKLAPNKTLLTDEYLQQFPKYRDVPYASKRTSYKNTSLDLDEDLLSNLGTLLDNYVPEEILDITVRYDKKNYTGEERRKVSLYCKDRYEKQMANHTKETFSFLQDFLQGTGWLQSTILFLGFYPDRDVSYFGLPYNLPVSFVAVLVVSFILSLVLMLQYSSHGIHENILTRKSSYLTFSNILFCSWDYCIEDRKTAAIRHKSINCEIKSNLAEEHRKLEVSRWSSEKRLKVYLLRISINILVIAALFGCFYLIYRVVNFQLEKQRTNALKDAGAYTLFIQFLSPLVITGLNIIMPVIFYSVAKFEMYATETEVNIALFRIVFLRLASVFVLVSSLYQQITCEPKDNCKAGMSEYCRSPICWETYVGQQLYKLVITDFLVYIFMFLGYDLPRDFIVQKCKCKVTEVVGRQVFDLPSQVLSLVYSQTLCWLGLFYSPLLPGISVLKFLIIFYIKKVVVLKHCVPAPVLYKASRSNSIFMTILMISLFFVTVIHGYSLTSIEPSPGCSPFRQYVVIINAVADAIADWSPKLVRFMTFVFSGFFFIPAFLLLSLIVYYYWTVVVAHRKMIKVLKAQIAVEGRDKQFLLNRLAEAAKQATTN